VTRPSGAKTIDEVLTSARAGLARLSPGQASEATADGAVLVDIRPAAQRAEEGEIPGALIVERNVLEWRFDPASSARLPLASYDLHVVVVCSEGYTSSLAAAALQELGVHRATDLDGGFQAWAAAGLPVRGVGQGAAGSGCTRPTSASNGGASHGGASHGGDQGSRGHSSDS
jgi:rhodanese-related sulfurtransferase